MDNQRTQQYFGTADFVVFVGSLLASALVGVFFAVKDRHKSNTVNYYFGGKKMPPIAVGVSLAVTYVSALTIIGSPTETYLYGTVALWYPFAYIPGTVVAVMYYIPMLHRLQVKTIYEYLEMRFSSSFRKLASAFELVSTMIYMCFALLVPALAINAVTPISLHWGIILTSAVCTAYTTVGGIKAVVWTDVVQFGFIFIGSTLALVMTIIELGGMGNIWSALDRGGRLNFFDFNPDPTLRSTAWTLLVGGGIGECVTMCASQSVCQRYLSCRTVAGAQRAAFSTFIPKFIISAICYASGAVAYAYFEGCDPLASGEVTKKDQVYPYLVLKVFRNLPGMAGLFVAAAFSGTLSTVSSGLNSMSAQLLEDFLIPFRPNLSSSFKNVFSKLAAFGLGVVITAITYLFLFLEGTVISMLMSVKSGFIGAVLGVYTLGMFLPWCNTKGAVAGQIAGFVVATWLGVDGIVSGRSPESQRQLPVSTQCCNATTTVCAVANVSSVEISFVETTTTHSSHSNDEYNPLRAVSFWYLSGVGLCVTVVIGLLVSFATRADRPEECDPRLFCPIIDNQRLPKSVRDFFRFGVPYVAKSQMSVQVCPEESQTIEDDSIVVLKLKSRDIQIAKESASLMSNK